MTAAPGRRLLQGNEAVVEGALAAGVGFYAGYPITPSTEIAESLSIKLPAAGGTFVQMEDEIASLGACLGASLAGAKAMTATSGPGFSLMQELVGYACMAEIPVTIVDVMRMGPSTGQPTAPSQADVMQARWGTHGDHPAIALTASTVQGAYEATLRAVALSERFRIPVILLLDEIVAHLREAVELPAPPPPAHRPKPSTPPEWFVPYDGGATGVPPMPAMGEGYRVHVTGLSHNRWGFPTEDPAELDALGARLHAKVSRSFAEIGVGDALETADAELLFVAFGAAARSARDAVAALRAAGLPAGLFELLTLWPFPRAALEAAARSAKTLLVCEMNRGQVYREAWRVARGRWTVRKLTRTDGGLIEPEQMVGAAREAAGWR